MERFVSNEHQFVFDSVLDWQPMEIDKDRSDVVKFLKFSDYPCG